MTAREYLTQARMIDSRINSKLMELQRARELATKATGLVSDMPRNPSPDLQQMESRVVKIVDLEREINAEIDHLCSLYFKDVELEYLGNLRFMKSDFIEFLSLFHLKRKYITVERDPSRPFGIDICIKGPWLHTILFEIPVLAIVNEVYFRRTYPGLSDAEGRRRLDATAAKSAGACRSRRYGDSQHEVH